MISDILCKTSAQKVLSFLLENPGERRYDREISRLSGVKKSSANYSLRALVEAGIVHIETRGRMLFYYTRPDDVLIRQLKRTKTLIELRELSEELKEISAEIILYGKAAEGSDTSRDGADLFVVSGNKREVAEIVGRSRFSAKINLFVSSPAEYNKLKRDRSLLLRDIEKGISLY